MGPMILEFAAWFSARCLELGATPIESVQPVMAITWGTVLKIATTLYGAYAGRKAAKENREAAKSASQPRTTTATSVPYMNEYISKLIPYILAEQQKIYESRLKGYGLDPGDFAPVAALLAGIPPSYTGVGGPGGPGGGQPGYDPVRVRLEGLTPEERQQLIENGMLEGMEGSLMTRTGGPNDRIRNFTTGSGNPFGAAQFSGVPAGDASRSGRWLWDALLGGFGREGGGARGSDQNEYGYSEWPAGKEPDK